MKILEEEILQLNFWMVLKCSKNKAFVLNSLGFKIDIFPLHFYASVIRTNHIHHCFSQRLFLFRI